MPSAALLEAVAVTAELCGRVFSEGAARVFVSDLSGYPEQQVIGSLARCRKEVRGLLTVADVIQRLDDGRPGADEAWSMLPRSESESVVWTDEMREAFSVASRIMEEDKIAARMAFKDAYKRAVDQSREQRKPVNWQASLGHDPRGREQVLQRAVERGHLTAQFALGLMPDAAIQVPHAVQKALQGVGNPLRIVA